MKVTVEQIDRQCENERIVRCHDPCAVWAESPGKRIPAGDGLWLTGGYAAPAETLRGLLFEVLEDPFFVTTQAGAFESKGSCTGLNGC